MAQSRQREGREIPQGSNQVNVEENPALAERFNKRLIDMIKAIGKIQAEIEALRKLNKSANDKDIYSKLLNDIRMKLMALQSNLDLAFLRDQEALRILDRIERSIVSYGGAVESLRTAGFFDGKAKKQLELETLELNKQHQIIEAMLMYEKRPLGERIETDRYIVKHDPAKTSSVIADKISIGFPKYPKKSVSPGRDDLSTPFDLENILLPWPEIIQSETGKNLLAEANNYFFGVEVVQDIPKALGLYEQEHDSGNIQATDILGYVYLKGLGGVFESKEKAFELFSYTAEKKSVFGSYFLAKLLFERYDGIKLEMERAVKLLQYAASKEHVGAMVELAQIIEKGDLLQQDLGRAYQLYQKAAEAGHPRALYHLAQLVTEHPNLNISEVNPHELLERSSQLDCHLAHYTLGSYYENSYPKNILKAKKYYEKAAQKGNDDAKAALGFILLLESEMKDDELGKMEAVQIAREVIYNIPDHKIANQLLGMAREYGLGVELDVDQSAFHYKVAADNGHREAQLRLGHLYYEGKLGIQNIEMAARYYTLAADAGHPDAMIALGCLYEKGDLGTVDVHRARSLYQRAADAGNPEGLVLIGMLHEANLLPYNDEFSTNETHAMSYYVKAHQLGDQTAGQILQKKFEAVSYTHLTLPTIYSV
eukprot:TRINITY_DN189_c0_g2_i1.p1 TRINITY_DN189_c0_g2~~TRINITY_DN189_c0_g2_i1.p1  ORF type:complete len:653 (+),score=151.58 TRINITY_DN189_c0_g2_i1:85-2043(+)